MVTPVRFVHRLPETLSLQSACLCEPLAVVLKGLKRLEYTWGPTATPRSCAVVGIGPIGHLAARILRQRGHHVTVFDRNPKRLEYFKGSNIATGDDLFDLNAFEVIVEATGDPDALDVILHNSEPGSTILLLGLPYSKRDFNFEAIVAYDKTIIGSVGSSSRDFEEAIQTMSSLDLSCFTCKIYPFAEFREAWNAFRSRKQLKILLEVNRMVK